MSGDRSDLYPAHEAVVTGCECRACCDCSSDYLLIMRAHSPRCISRRETERTGT